MLCQKSKVLVIIQVNITAMQILQLCLVEYAGIQYSLSTDKKDSGTKKSYMGIVRKEKIGYSKDSYQILNRTQV